MSHGGDSWESAGAQRRETERSLIESITKWLRWRKAPADLVGSLSTGDWKEELEASLAYDRVLQAQRELHAAELALKSLKK
jgi:hypothetical protein